MLITRKVSLFGIELTKGSWYSGEKCGEVFGIWCVRMSVDVVAAPEVEMTIEVLQRIVALKVANVPDWQIAKGFGIEEDLLPELYKTEEYEKEFAKHFAEQIKHISEANDGWDGLERKAIFRLNAELDRIGFIDPDFALKVAVHANKAARRPLVGDRKSVV